MAQNNITLMLIIFYNFIKNRRFMRVTKTLLFLFAAIFFYACQNNTQEKPVIEANELKEPLVGANKILVQREAEDIEGYIRRHNLQMEKTGTGLRIMIYKEGVGIPVQSGDAVQINYTVSLINGVQVYNYKEDGPLEFVTGQAEVINGLEEAILLMNHGSKAKTIIPSHLAYGLLGDDNKIPKRATLIYDIEIVNIFRPS